MAQAFGLYSHIRANQVRTVAIFLALVGLFYLLAYGVCVIAAAFLYPKLTAGVPTAQGVINVMREAGSILSGGSLYVAGALAAWTLIGFLGNRMMIDAVMGGEPVTRADDPRLYRLLENLCISRGMRMPALRIVHDPALNAYASGLYESQYAVTVTSGLRDALTDRELEAVLAHELAHIRNGDVRLMVIAVVIAGIFGLVVELVLRLGSRMSATSFGRSSDRKGGGFAAIVIALLVGLSIMALAWLLSGLLRFFLSRTREFLADAGAVELTKDPDAMIAALMKVSGHAEMERAPSAVMELCFENFRSGIFDMFATHPPIDERIEALSRFAGGRVQASVPAFGARMLQRH